MDQIKLLKGERDALEQKLKAGGDTEEISMLQFALLNILYSSSLEEYISNCLSFSVEKFSQLNTESNLFNDEGLSTEHLEKTYGPLQASVEDTIRQQDELIAKITVSLHLFLLLAFIKS